jgi:hypothetical protein
MGKIGVRRHSRTTHLHVRVIRSYCLPFRAVIYNREMSVLKIAY